jgi:prepilin-type N-terminal cleavage/methylation domain-containing protein
LRKKSFTLVELMVTIAIMGTIASIVLSNITEMRVKAQQAKTVASLRSAQTTATYCVDDNQNFNTPDGTKVVSCTVEGYAVSWYR